MSKYLNTILQFLFLRLMILLAIFNSNTFVSYITVSRFAKCNICYMSLNIFHAKVMPQFTWYHLNHLKITHASYHQNRSYIRQSTPYGTITRQHGAWAVFSGRLIAEWLGHRLHKCFSEMYHTHIQLRNYIKSVASIIVNITINAYNYT